MYYNVFVRGNEPKMTGAMADYIAGPIVNFDDEYDIFEVIGMMIL